MLSLLKHMKAAMADMAEVYGLTPIQLYALHAIKGDTALSATDGTVIAQEIAKQPTAEMTMGGLAQILRCDASNVTGIVDRLVALTLISRREHPQDRRAKILQLTAQGNRVIESIQAELPGKLGCDRLDTLDRQALQSIVQKLRAD